MRPATKCYMALISVLGLCTGVFCAYRFLLVLSGPWNLSYTGVFLVLLLFAWGSCCLPLYLREDCTVDLSFISILATILILGPDRTSRKR